MKHTDTRSTLALIDATLRLTEKPLWQDPEFLEWKRGQVDDDTETAWYQPFMDSSEVVTVTVHDYPAAVTHGPLMLGPEPGPVRLPADVVPV